MNSFRHFFPPLRIFSGDDSLKQLGRELERLGSRRAVIFCGPSLAREQALLNLVRAEAGARCAGVYAQVAAHSPLPQVEAAAAELQRLQADAVIALGGGSAVVTARAASILLAEKAGVRQLCTARDAASGELRSPKLLAPKIPQLVIPTTPTTATVKAGSAVLDPVNNGRLALFDPKTRAAAVFVHPDAIASAPRSLVVSASLGALGGAAQGLLSRAGDPFSDGLLIHALRLLAEHLPAAATHDSAPAREPLMMAALLSGHATDYTGAGIGLPLGHAISARFHLDGGIASAIVLPHVIRFNASAAPHGMAKLAQALGLPRAAGAEDVAAALTALFSSLGTPARLRDVDIPRESLPALAAVAMDDWFVRDNPRRVQHASELEEVLRQAW
jgi:alcohol dehydrogenase class IV